MLRCGMQGKARLGKARQGTARQGKARQGKARQGKARQGKARQGKARQGKARQGKAKLVLYYQLCCELGAHLSLGLPSPCSTRTKEGGRTGHDHAYAKVA